jgi:hypothetical protein
VRVEPPAGVQADRPALDPIARIVVLEEGARSVPCADLDHEPVTALEDRAGGQYLDLDRDHLAGTHLPDLVVRMVRAVGSRALRVELAV